MCEQAHIHLGTVPLNSLPPVDANTATTNTIETGYFSCANATTFPVYLVTLMTTAIDDDNGGEDEGRRR